MFYKGCGTYLRHLSEVAAAKSFLNAQEQMRAATEHRKKCPKCIAMNGNLLNQFFRAEVVVVEDKNAAD